MDFLYTLLPVATGTAGFLTGGFVTWLICRKRASLECVRLQERRRVAERAIVDLEAGSANLEAEVRQYRQTESALLKRHGELEMLLQTQRRGLEEKEQLLKEAEHRMGQNFKALSAEALKTTQQEFIKQVRADFEAHQRHADSELEQRRIAVEVLVKPVAATLDKVESRIGDLEKAREDAYANLREQVSEMASVQAGLQKETSHLVRALRQPSGRSEWGAMQLRRVVELAGMQEHADFITGAPDEEGAGRRPRPDLIVNLPAGKQIVVDSKTPMDAFLDSMQAEDDESRDACLKLHAESVRERIRTLSSKSYQTQFVSRPEFVVLFLPSESFFSTALNEDPSLIELGVDQGIIVATPTTLIALLRAVAAGWREENIADNARHVSEVGRELYTKVSALAEKFARVGQSIDSTVRNYNKAMGSFDNEILPNARKLGELGAAPREAAALATVPKVEHTAKSSPHALSSLPLTDPAAQRLAATGEVPGDDFEGFTEPETGTEESIAGEEQSPPFTISAEEEAAAEDAARDLAAALEEERKLG